MDTYNKDTGIAGQQDEKTSLRSHRSGRTMSGLFIVAIGAILLAREAGVNVPHWIFSFESMLIALGLYLGIRHSFRGFAWLVPLAAGTFLLVDDFFPEYGIEDFTWPLIIIGVGLFIMFRPGKKKFDLNQRRDCQMYPEDSADDVLDSVVVFGGAKKNIITKNFRGGEAVTVFGGTEINLMQADLTSIAVLELTQVFGGTKLIVPPHWKIQSTDMVAIFGGIDDKRPMMSNPDAQDANKTLILKGTCMMGGIDIRSY